ncbi:MAG TPA: 50S ribosomal protein L24 [Candidatus Absconditabacterales bacterium]|nr:50S ribosomal protein L24 [Candidatus Absconditabacterales bacterium]HOQ79031.1 50S ribosomal protein L24 [Candidatus Absconditabacterales bacterium]HPK27633.1 50S ribosomal protein L24 [Candidatus Absconditabacterales bacterium]
MKKLKSGDPVIVISGKYKGKISTIEKIDGDYAIVKNINVVKKAMKGKGFIKKTLPIHISNIMYYLEKEKKASKIRIEITSDGKKIRKTKKGDIKIK